MSFVVKKIKFYSKKLQKWQDFILAIPKDLNNVHTIDLYIVMDGEDLLAKENNILVDNNSQFVYLGVSSDNKYARFDDFSIYKNYEIKNILSNEINKLFNNSHDYVGGGGLNYSFFIFKELIPHILEMHKWEINSLNFFGCSLGAYFALQQICNNENKFNKLNLFSPSIWFNNLIFNDLQQNAVNQGEFLIINLWVGKKEPHFFAKTIATNYYQDALDLQMILSEKPNVKVNFFLDENGNHGYYSWINFINNHQENW